MQDEVIRQNCDEQLKVQSAEQMLSQHDVENIKENALVKFQQYPIVLKTSDPTNTYPRYPPRAESKNFNSNIIFDYSDRVSQALSKQTIADFANTGESRNSSAFTRTPAQNSSLSSYQAQRKSAKKNSNGSNTSSLQRSQNAPSENNTSSEKIVSQDSNAPP
jgi:hypothetical protein